MSWHDDAVKKELRKIGKSRKNQDRRIKVHGNYRIAIEAYYKYPLPSFHSCITHGEENERERREGKGRKGREKGERKKGSSGGAGSRIEIVGFC